MFGRSHRNRPSRQRRGNSRRWDHRLISTTHFQGNKLEKSSELEITWHNEMHFNGEIANFHGNVQATQDNTRLLCHNMQVTLDQRVNFKSTARQRGQQTANVSKVVCNTTGRRGLRPSASPIACVKTASMTPSTNRIARATGLQERKDDCKLLALAKFASCKKVQRMYRPIAPQRANPRLRRRRLSMKAKNSN